MAGDIPDITIGDEDGTIAPEFIRAVTQAVEKQDKSQLDLLVADLHEADLADLIELLAPDDRRHFISLLGKDLNYSALSELDEAVRDDVLEILPNTVVAEAVRELDSDDAVYLLENLDEAEKSDILGQLPAADRATLERSLEYPEDSAGRLMQTDFISVPGFWSVGQTIDFLRQSKDLPDSFQDIFVVDPANHLLGKIALDRILRTQRDISIRDIMEVDPITVAADLDQEEVAHIFERYNLISAAVADEFNRLVGVVTIDDVVDVIHEEASEDIHRLGGVGDESLADSVFSTVTGRLTWLLINLATAILASLVISLFDATIEQLVALAVLMPIVASMGGNAGTQTMTVAVRSIAMRDLGPVNAGRVVTREVLVGLINGCIFALIMGVVAYFWFDNITLGLVIAAAMTINMIVAGLSGIVIPIALDRLDIDPAIASSVFVTTVTDVVGFFSFLGLAAWWLT
jgi:magnesium transporter